SPGRNDPAVAQVSDPGTEAAQAPSRRRAASRHRRASSRRRGLELAGPPPVNSPPVMVRGSSGPPGSPMAPDPAALDAEWAAYSDRSGCADWAGGDGVSAIRLNFAQLAWFFSDTFIGPAGPDIGFSQVSGFAHNAVVVQTGTRLGSAFVTVTGGGACTGPGRPGNAAPV